MQSFGLILYNMSLWTFLFQRSADSCCFFCPKIKLGGESGRAATDADNYLRSLESAHKTMNDVWDALEEIRTYMDETKRINKHTIYQKLSEAISQIKNDL